ncbi:MAG: hypothetical protein HY833_02365 [Candidatus Aenigmarchaeota archaeon]|nr:hypothetical protein [Candidatus Aenigmarchaeota archaeon]
MEAMVTFVKGKKTFFYSIEDVAKFSTEVDRRLEGAPLGKFDPRKLPAHSLKVGAALPYQDLMAISHRYGRPIYEGQFKKNLRRGGWYTKPSLTTNMAKALVPAGMESPESYTIAIRPERKVFAGRPNYTR